MIKNIDMNAIPSTLESHIECCVFSFVRVLAQMSAVHCTAKKVSLHI